MEDAGSRDDHQLLCGRDDGARFEHPLAATIGTELSPETISTITDQVAEEVLAWQQRPLDASIRSSIRCLYGVEHTSIGGQPTNLAVESSRVVYDGVGERVVLK